MALWAHSEKAAIYKPRNNLSLAPKVAYTLISNFQLPEPWEINFHCLSHLLFGILLWLPELPNTRLAAWRPVVLVPSSESVTLSSCGSGSFIRPHLPLCKIRSKTVSQDKLQFWNLWVWWHEMNCFVEECVTLSLKQLARPFCPSLLWWERKLRPQWIKWHVFLSVPVIPLAVPGNVVSFLFLFLLPSWVSPHLLNWNIGFSFLDLFHWENVNKLENTKLFRQKFSFLK